MLSVSDRYLQAINADSRRILHRVTLGKSVVLDQTSVPKITLDENIGGNSGVSLGTANSASLKLTLRDPAVIDYTDMLVEPEGGVELPDGTIEWLPLGKFYVTDSSTSNDYRTVELTCADGMYLMSGEYISNLIYPALVRDVAREIANQAGVEFDEPSVWPAIYIRKKPEKQTLRNAIGYVAGCCGKNARFNRYGRLEFVWYKDTGLTIERTQQYLDGFTRLNDQSLNVNFNVTGEVEKYKVTVISDDNGNAIANPGTSVEEGATVTLSVVPLYQYELSSISAETADGTSITLWQNGNGNEYMFTQPDSDVTVNVTFKQTDGTSSGGAAVSGGEYSFLQHPSLAAPSHPKPYWAIFYKHDTNVGPNAKYYLVWFDSWSLGDRIYLEDKNGYYLNISGCYYCQGANNGRGQHYWDDAVWQGNGDPASVLTWRMGIGRGCDGYGLLASNTSLGDIFTANAEEVGTVQSSWLVGGVDIREKGALSLYACPDTYSTPLPGKYWMLTNHVRVYKTDTDGSYKTLLTGSSEAYVLFFDGCVITDLGKYYSFHDGNYLKLTFSKLTVASYSGYDEFYYAGERTINEECYVIISDPDYSSAYESGGGLEYPIGLYATNLSSSYFSNNSPMICDCASSASVAKFAMRRIAGATVTMDYTNPLITAKMTDSISAVVEGVSYTPSKVKHRGNPALEVGDIVTVPDKDGNYHTVLIMQQTMVFGGGMNATITCPGQTEKKSNFSNTGALTTQIKQVVQEQSYHQKQENDNYNSVVVSALSRSMSSLSRQVTADGVTIKLLNEWRGTASATIAGLEVKVNENESAVREFVSWQDETTKSLASISRNVSENYSEIYFLTQWKYESEEDVASIAEIRMTTDANSASIESLTEWQGETNTTLTSINQRVNNAEAEIEFLSQLFGDDTESVAELVIKVNANEANIASLTEWKDDTVVSLASIEQTVTKNASEIDLLSKWKNDVEDDVASVAEIKLTTNNNSASIETLTEWQGGVNISIASIRETADDNKAEIETMSAWKDETNESIASIKQTANAQGASIELLVEDGEVKGNVLVEAINGQSAVKINADVIDLEGAELNIKVDATNITGKLTADQIELNGMTFVEGSGSVYKNTEFVSDAIRFERGVGSCFLVEETYNGAPYGMSVYAQVGYGDGCTSLSMDQYGATGSGSLGGRWDVSVNGRFGPVDLVSWMQAIYEALSGLQGFIDTTSDYLNDYAMIACAKPSCSIDEGLEV